MPSAFQPCHIAPAPVTTSHLPGPLPRAASVQKGKDGGRSRGRTAGGGTESRGRDVEAQRRSQDALLEHGGSRVRFQSLSPGRGRGGAIQAWRPAAQIPVGDTRLWSAATAAGAARERSRCRRAPPTLPGFAAITARSPKTGPSCLKKPRRLEPGALPTVCFTAKPSERLRGSGSLSPHLLSRSLCLLLPEPWHLRLSLLLQ